MKRLLQILCSAVAACWLWSSCVSEEAQPVKYKAPEVEFTMPSDVITAVVGQGVSFSAKVVSGDKVSAGWYIDDVLASSSQTFEYVFEEAGSYKVRFEARNGAGVVSHEYTVNVSDILSITLSVGDSTKVVRRQLDILRVAAVVEYGKEVTHEWRVDGVLLGEEAYFGTFRLDEARPYTVSYHGANMDGVFDKTFTVEVSERPLEIVFSNTDEIIALLTGRTLSITATVRFGGTGLQQKWILDDEVVSQGASFSYLFTSAGEYELKYEAQNAKGETVERSWKINVASSGRLFEDFEAETLGAWFNVGENQPGIELVENPLQSGLNTSRQCLRDKVNGSGSTSGYFTMKAPKMLSDAGFDVSEYTGIRFLVYLGANKYYPRVDYAGTKYTSVAPPKFNGEWEVLEYKLPEGVYFDNTKNIVFRMMYNESGSNISGGDVNGTENNRTVYIDDIEFFK
ncbi:MAG: PKD domain-containing protein [Bacteroidales bacterium]|nr:PKD domain-containing protein [Bacteroidales bacterium]